MTNDVGWIVRAAWWSLRVGNDVKSQNHAPSVALLAEMISMDKVRHTDSDSDSVTVSLSSRLFVLKLNRNELIIQDSSSTFIGSLCCYQLFYSNLTFPEHTRGVDDRRMD